MLRHHTCEIFYGIMWFATRNDKDLHIASLPPFSSKSGIPLRMPRFVSLTVLAEIKVEASGGHSTTLSLNESPGRDQRGWPDSVSTHPGSMGTRGGGYQALPNGSTLLLTGLEPTLVHVGANGSFNPRRAVGLGFTFVFYQRTRLLQNPFPFLYRRG